MNREPITRRSLLSGIATAAGASAVAGGCAALAATYEVSAVETPEQRYERAQAEMIAATKALNPEVSDWRIMRPDDCDGRSRCVGMFMIVGHPPKGVQS
jgi:hypothetical protein